MVFGTFDIIHPGHLAFLREAKRHGNYLIVSVARSNNVKKVKGHLPVHSERQRVLLLKALRMVDKVVLGDKTGYLKHIARQKPDVICLGYDQKAYTEKLGVKLRRLGLKIRIVRCKVYQPKKYRSSKILRIL